MRIGGWLAAAAAGTLLVAAACSGPQPQSPPSPAAGPAVMDRTVLPIQEPPRPAVTEIGVPAGGANGTIIAQGGRFGGWSLCVKNGVTVEVK